MHSCSLSPSQLPLIAQESCRSSLEDVQLQSHSYNIQAGQSGWAVLPKPGAASPDVPRDQHFPPKRAISEGIAMRDTCSGGDIAKPHPSVLPVLARAPRLPQNPATLISHTSACQPSHLIS